VRVWICVALLNPGSVFNLTGQLLLVIRLACETLFLLVNGTVGTTSPAALNDFTLGHYKEGKVVGSVRPSLPSERERGITPRNGEGGKRCCFFTWGSSDH